MSASPSDVSLQVDAGQIHPDFGYFAPTMRFRRKFALALKAAVFGGLAGAVAMFFVTIGREEKPLTMLATPVLIAPVSSTPTVQAPAPVAMTLAAPVRAPAVAAPATSTPTPPARPSRVATDAIAPPLRFLPETMALPAAAPHDLGLRGSTPTIAATASGPVSQAPGTHGAATAVSAAAGAPTAVAKPKKKTVRAPPEPEPEPRAAFARPLRSLGLPIFGFGW